MTSHAIEKVHLLIEEIDDAVYNEEGYSFISGLLDELKQYVIENFAPGIVVPADKEIITYQNDYNKGINNPVDIYWVDVNGVMQHRKDVTEVHNGLHTKAIVWVNDEGEQS